MTRPPTRLHVDSEFLHRHQKAIALATLAIPAIGFLVAVWVAFRTPGDWGVMLGLFLVGYLATTLGVSVGFHRHFTHRSFRANRATRAALGVLGSMAAQGPLLFWVSTHRRHHAFSDVEGDAHSPNLGKRGLRGLVHAHAGWMVTGRVTDPTQFAKDLLRDETATFVNRHYWRWVGLGLVLPAVAGGILTASPMGLLQGFLWGGLARIFVVHHVTWSLNSLAHVVGVRAFEVSDHSRNLSLLAWPSVGESWHNNHHAFPRSARFGIGRGEADVGYAVIRALEWLGWAWEVTVPEADEVAAKAPARC